MAVWHCKWSIQTSAAQIEKFVSLNLFFYTNLRDQSMSTQDMATGTQKIFKKFTFSNNHNQRILMSNPTLVIFYHYPSFSPCGSLCGPASEQWDSGASKCKAAGRVTGCNHFILLFLGIFVWWTKSWPMWHGRALCWIHDNDVLLQHNFGD